MTDDRYHHSQPRTPAGCYEGPQSAPDDDIARIFDALTHADALADKLASLASSLHAVSSEAPGCENSPGEGGAGIGPILVSRLQALNQRLAYALSALTAFAGDGN